MNYNGHDIILIRSGNPDNLYQCVRCKGGWVAKRKTDLVKKYHMSFVADGECKGHN